LIVLDANILIRAVLGRRARALVEEYGGRVALVVADVAVLEARERLAELAGDRRLAFDALDDVLNQMLRLFETAGPELYGPFANRAQYLISDRDPDDWPTLALSLALDCRVWTEDYDFFGIGVATWATKHVGYFFRRQAGSGEERRTTDI
jgi:predicted nucleic acid-binding protein